MTAPLEEKIRARADGASPASRARQATCCLNGMPWSPTRFQLPLAAVEMREEVRFSITTGNERAVRAYGGTPRRVASWQAA